MEFKEVVGLRRSIRFYKPWRPVEREKIQTILEAARLASRAVNARFAHAVVVYRDQVSEEDRNALKTPTTTAQLDLAPVWIFWYGDLNAVMNTNRGQTLHQLVDAWALTPSHGWSHRYVDDVIWAQVLQPIASSPEVLSLLVAEEASLAICQALLCAVDEGLGTQLTAFNADAAKRILGVPDHFLPLWLQLVGYPAEEREAGGQRPREPFEEMFSEGRYGVPFRRDEQVVERLKAAKMIQDPAPFPWRRDEVRALSNMFGLPE
jgi:nitroreductase